MHVRAVLLFLLLSGLVLFVCMGQIAKRGGDGKTLVEHETHGYADNYKYSLLREMHALYRPRISRIVMLGDSITYKCDWNELLSRNDVVNRGIGGDITEGYLNRLDDIYQLKPEACFIMGGINDFLQGLGEETVYRNLIAIAESLREKGIRPILQSTLMLSKQRRPWREVNAKVSRLNERLKEYARAQHMDYIDLNARLADGRAMNARHVVDGMHLRASAYEIWRDLILEKLCDPDLCWSNSLLEQCEGSPSRPVACDGISRMPKQGG